MEIQEITPATCIVRDTAGKKGRTESVAPGKTTASRHLHYGRIILDAGQSQTVENGERETGLICLKGAASVAVGGATHTLNRYDALYGPRDASA